MQYFKGDTREQQFFNSLDGVLQAASADKDDFFADAYQCYILGDILHDSDASPLTNAVKKDIFRSTFPEIFDAFIVSGTFESYISVFKKIFGDTVEIDFTVPAPGKLNIDIVAVGIELANGVARTVEDNNFVISPLITQDEDFIMFQVIQGFQSQYELEQMLYELVPTGIYTTINLTLGEA